MKKRHGLTAHTDLMLISDYVAKLLFVARIKALFRQAANINGLNTVLDNNII